MSDAPAIYAALAAVMADVDHVAKRDLNQHQRFHFRGIDAVVNAVGPVLRKHQVIVTPDVESVGYDVVATSTGKPATACRVVVAYTFHAVDGSSLTTRVAAEAWDAGDKAAPKAMSVAFRTALLQALALPTDEPDPDSQVYERDNRPSRPAAGIGDPPGWDGQVEDKPMSDVTRRRMFALLTEAGVTDPDQQRDGMSKVLGRMITSRSQLTEHEAQRVIRALEARKPTKP